MDSQTSQKIKFFLIVLVFFLLTGCAAKGAYFSEISIAPEGQSMLYIYRPGAFTSSGVNFPIVINDKRITPELSNQSFLTYIAQPGKQKIHTDTPSIDRVLEFNAEPNKTYFISISVKNYVMVFANVPNLVDKTLALQEMEKCRLAL